MTKILTENFFLQCGFSRFRQILLQFEIKTAMYIDCNPKAEKGESVLIRQATLL